MYGGAGVLWRHLLPGVADKQTEEGQEMTSLGDEVYPG